MEKPFSRTTYSSNIWLYTPYSRWSKMTFHGLPGTILQPLPPRLRARRARHAPGAHRRPDGERRRYACADARGGEAEGDRRRVPGIGALRLQLRGPVPPAGAIARRRASAGLAVRALEAPAACRVRRPAGRGRRAALQLRGADLRRAAARGGAQDLPAELPRVLRTAPVHSGRRCGEGCFSRRSERAARVF